MEVFRPYRTDRTPAGPSIDRFVRLPSSKSAIRGTPFHRQRSPVGLPSSSHGSALGLLRSFRSSSCAPRASIAVFPRFTDPPFCVAKHAHVASSLGRVDVASTTRRLRNGTKHLKKKGVFSPIGLSMATGRSVPFDRATSPFLLRLQKRTSSVSRQRSSAVR